MASKKFGLSQKEINLLTNKINEEVERIRNKLKFSPDDFKNEELSDSVDQACADSDNASRLRFRNREIFYLKKLLKSLEKIKEEVYGECEDCGVDIGFERLIARPTAELCIDCKEESEREESLSWSKKSKSLGESINLVSNI